LLSAREGEQVANLLVFSFAPTSLVPSTWSHNFDQI